MYRLSARVLNLITHAADFLSLMYPSDPITPQTLSTPGHVVVVIPSSWLRKIPSDVYSAMHYLDLDWSEDYQKIQVREF